MTWTAGARSHRPRAARAAAAGTGAGGARGHAEKCQGACKPGSVPPTVSAGRTVSAAAAIHLGGASPRRSSSQPGSSGAKRPAPCETGSLFGLAPGGVCHAGAVAGAPVRSYRTLSALPVPVTGPSAVFFLWHFPSANVQRHPPGGRYPPPLLRGARTFLERIRARGCPAPWRGGHSSHRRKENPGGRTLGPDDMGWHRRDCPEQPYVIWP